MDNNLKKEFTRQAPPAEFVEALSKTPLGSAAYQVVIMVEKDAEKPSSSNSPKP